MSIGRSLDALSRARVAWNGGDAVTALETLIVAVESALTALVRQAGLPSRSRREVLRSFRWAYLRGARFGVRDSLLLTSLWYRDRGTAVELRMEDCLRDAVDLVARVLRELEDQRCSDGRP